MLTRDTRYRSLLNSVLTDAQLVGKSVGGYRIRIGEDAYSLRFEVTITSEVRGYCPSAQNDGYDTIN